MVKITEHCNVALYTYRFVANSKRVGK